MQQQQLQQQQMSMGDYNSQNYQDPNDFGQGGMRQDFSLDDLNFDPAYMMDNNCTDDLAVSAYHIFHCKSSQSKAKLLHIVSTFLMHAFSNLIGIFVMKK